MKKLSKREGLHPTRRDRLIQEHVHDAYKSRWKYPEPTRCPECGAVFSDGRWHWGAAPAGAHEAPCPACRRVRDRLPAGFVTLRGPFFMEHRDEILHRARHVEERERSEHPLQRIMGIEEVDGGVCVTTADIHLARAIGEALHHAWHGRLDFHYNPEEDLLRVTWER